MQQQNKEPQAQQVEPKSLTHQSLYYSYIQRYYTTYSSQTHYVHMHSNGLFLIRPKLSQITQNGKLKPKQIRWLVNDVEVKGKKKKGGFKVKPKTHIAHIVLESAQNNNQEDQIIFKVEACVQGVIIEQNQSITVQKLEQKDGYFVIIMPNKKFVASEHNMEQVTYINNKIIKVQ